MVDEGPTQFLLAAEGAVDDAESSGARVCDECGERADWVLTDRTGITHGFICVPCHEVLRRRRNRWHRRVTRHLRHAVRRT
jgi:hypothetical protein